MNFSKLRRAKLNPFLLLTIGLQLLRLFLSFTIRLETTSIQPKQAGL